MPRFPIKEAEILRLAQQMIAGFKRRPQDFLAPYVPVEQMERELANARQGLLKSTGTEAASREATAEKDRLFNRLAKTMSVNLRYSEYRARKDPLLLHAVGWAPRRPRRPMRAPGEVLELQIVEELETAIVLKWRKPVDGGRVAGYRVQRRRAGRGGWEDVSTAMGTRVILDHQERGVEYEYRVLAFNKAGAGHVSNTVRAVL